MQPIPVSGAAGAIDPSSIGGNMVLLVDSNMHPIATQSLQTVDPSVPGTTTIFRPSQIFPHAIATPQSFIRPLYQTPVIMPTNAASVFNSKDSRWLTLEVCREFQRGKCSRSEDECKFAHPPDHVEVTNGKVIACYDNLKGRCQRISPPCKYLHPPNHLKEILLHNGRNNLLLRTIAMQRHQNSLQQQQRQQQASLLTTPLYRTTPQHDRLLAANATTGLTNGFSNEQLLLANQIAQSNALAANTPTAVFPGISPQAPAPLQLTYTTPNALTNLMASLQGSANVQSMGTPTIFAVNPANGTATPISLNLGYVGPQVAATNQPQPHTQRSQAMIDIGVGNQAYSIPAAAFFANPQGFATAAAVAASNGLENSTMISPNVVTLRPSQGHVQNVGHVRTDRLEVCANFQRGTCPFTSSSCPYAHPPTHCPIDNEGLVTVCVDFVKGKCLRDVCKYFHPPDHLLLQLKAASSSSSNTLNQNVINYSLISGAGIIPTTYAATNNTGQTLVYGQIIPTATTPSNLTTGTHSHHYPTNSTIASIHPHGNAAIIPNVINFEFSPQQQHQLAAHGVQVRASNTNEALIQTAAPFGGGYVLASIPLASPLVTSSNSGITSPSSTTPTGQVEIASSEQIQNKNLQRANITSPSRLVNSRSLNLVLDSADIQHDDPTANNPFILTNRTRSGSDSLPEKRFAPTEVPITAAAAPQSLGGMGSLQNGEQLTVSNDQEETANDNDASGVVSGQSHTSI